MLLSNGCGYAGLALCCRLLRWTAFSMETRNNRVDVWLVAWGGVGRTISYIHSSPWKVSWRLSKVGLVRLSSLTSYNNIRPTPPQKERFFQLCWMWLCSFLETDSIYPYPLRSSYLRPKAQTSPICLFIGRTLKRGLNHGLRRSEFRSPKGWRSILSWWLILGTRIHLSFGIFPASSLIKRLGVLCTPIPAPHARIQRTGSTVMFASNRDATRTITTMLWILHKVLGTSDRTSRKCLRILRATLLLQRFASKTPSYKK